MQPKHNCLVTKLMQDTERTNFYHEIIDKHLLTVIPRKLSSIIVNFLENLYSNTYKEIIIIAILSNAEYKSKGEVHYLVLKFVTFAFELHDYPVFLNPSYTKLKLRLREMLFSVCLNLVVCICICQIIGSIYFV